MLAETERFVWLAGDTLYTGSRSKWKLWLNKIASSVDQQAKPWMLSHTRSCTCRMLEVTHTSPTSPSPQMDRSKSMSADYKTATGPFHFCLDKAAVLNGSPRSAFTLDQTASIWRNKAYSCCLFCFCFSRPPRPNNLYHRPLQKIKPLKQLRKWSQPPVIRSPTTTLGWQIFRGTGMKTTLTLESLVVNVTFLLLCQGGDWSGKQKIYFKKRKKWASFQVPVCEGTHFVGHCKALQLWTGCVSPSGGSVNCTVHSSVLCAGIVVTLKASVVVGVTGIVYSPAAPTSPPLPCYSRI